LELHDYPPEQSFLTGACGAGITGSKGNRDFDILAVLRGPAFFRPQQETALLEDSVKCFSFKAGDKKKGAENLPKCFSYQEYTT
jgi:hypothetical protein